MRRVRAKGKKLSVDDTGSGEEVKLPVQKRRGRPQKSLKDEDEVLKLEDEEESEDSAGAPNMQNKTGTQNGKKPKTNAQADSMKEENETEETQKSNGFRSNGNRRKNKPRRAAEAVVECN